MADEFTIYLSRNDPKLANKAASMKESSDFDIQTKTKKPQKDEASYLKREIKEEKMEFDEKANDLKIKKSQKDESVYIKQDIKQEKMDVINELKIKSQKDEKPLKKITTNPEIIKTEEEPRVQKTQEIKTKIDAEHKSQDDVKFFNSIFEPSSKKEIDTKKTKKSKKLYSSSDDAFKDHSEGTKPKKEKSCSPKNACNSSASLSSSRSTNDSVSINEEPKNTSHRDKSDEDSNDSNDSDKIVVLNQTKPANKAKDFNIVDRDPQKDLEISKTTKLSLLKSDIIEYMILSDMNYYVNIFAGKCEHSWRHLEFKKNTHQASKLLCMNAATGGYSHDQYMTATYALRSVFCKSGNKYDDYIVKVLLPEALIKICMRIHQCSKDDAEEFLQKCNTRNAVEFSEFKRQKNVLNEFD